MRRTAHEILMRRYLLGDLPQEERARLEDGYSTDADMFEEMLATENDLIDSYVRGELTEVERRQFEAEFLQSPQRQEKVEFARTLNQVSAERMQTVSARGTSHWQELWAAFSVRHSVQPLVSRMAMVAVALVVVAGGTWLLVLNARLRIDLQQARAGQSELLREQGTLRQHITELEGSLKEQSHQDQQGVEVAQLNAPAEVRLSLTPGIARTVGEAQSTLVLPPTAARVRLQLMLERDDYANYLAVVRTAEGKEVSRQRLKSQGSGNQRTVVVVLPAGRLRAGDYVVTLLGSSGTSGAEEEAEVYSFRIVRK
jgi:hypothetical protein